MNISAQLLLTFIFLAVFNFQVQAETQDVRIVSPKQGQEFAPGDLLNIDVEISPSLQATDGYISISEWGNIETKEFYGTRLKAQLIIPDFLSGPIKLDASAYVKGLHGQHVSIHAWPGIAPWIMPGGRSRFMDGRPYVHIGGLLEAQQVTIHVRPKDAPKELVFSNRNEYILPTSKETHLNVSGIYQNGLRRDLTSPVTGTTYVSSDAAVISVDQEGKCTAEGKGSAVITIEHMGVRGFVMFKVEDPQHPNPPVNITNKVSIERGRQREEENGNRVVQEVTVTNITDLPLMGPLHLLVKDLPDGIRAYGETVWLSLPDGLNLFPEQSVKAELVFLFWRDVQLDYNLELYENDPLMADG